MAKKNLPPPWDDGEYEAKEADWKSQFQFWKPEPGKDQSVRILPAWQEAERLKYAAAKEAEIAKLKQMERLEREMKNDPRRAQPGDIAEWRCECGTRWKYGDLCAQCGRYRPEYAAEKYPGTAEEREIAAYKEVERLMRDQRAREMNRKAEETPVCTICGNVVAGGLTVHTGCAARAMQGLDSVPGGVLPRMPLLPKKEPDPVTLGRERAPIVLDGTEV